MDLQLRLLETFNARGRDGKAYKVCAYDRLVPDPSLPAQGEHWESSGVIEYRLEDGRRIDVDGQGHMRVHGTDVVLESEKASASP